MAQLDITGSNAFQPASTQEEEQAVEERVVVEEEKENTATKSCHGPLFLLLCRAAALYSLIHLDPVTMVVTAVVVALVLVVEKEEEEEESRDDGVEGDLGVFLLEREEDAAAAAAVTIEQGEGLEARDHLGAGTN